MKPLACCLILLVSAAGRSGAAEQKSETVRYSLPAGGTLSVENVRGTIAVQAWDRSEVEATIVKTAPRDRSCLGAVSVAVEQRPRSLSFVTLYPGDSQDQVQVDYRLRVPGNIVLDSLQSVDGDILVQGIEGAIRAQTLRGDIREQNVSGPINDRTLHGNIALAMSDISAPGDPMNLETINGNIELLLPAGTNADLLMRTLAGRIINPFMSLASAVPGETYRRARMGRGGVTIRLVTVRGDIEVGENGTI